MGTKQTSTKKTPDTPANRFELKLAKDLSEVLANPYCPDRLSEAITQQLSELLAEVPRSQSLGSPDAIERILNFHQGFGFRNI